MEICHVYTWDSCCSFSTPIIKDAMLSGRQIIYESWLVSTTCTPLNGKFVWVGIIYGESGRTWVTEECYGSND